MKVLPHYVLPLDLLLVIKGEKGLVCVWVGGGHSQGGQELPTGQEAMNSLLTILLLVCLFPHSFFLKQNLLLYVCGHVWKSEDDLGQGRGELGLSSTFMCDRGETSGCQVFRTKTHLLSHLASPTLHSFFTHSS